MYLISFQGLWGEFNAGRHERTRVDRAVLFRPNPTANPVSANKERYSCIYFSVILTSREATKESS